MTRANGSTSALLLRDIPKRLLVIGGGIIGLEMATVYQALGSKVTVVELLDGLIPGVDRDLIRPLQRRIEKRYEAIHLKTKVTRLEPLPEGLRATFEGESAPAPQVYDRVLLSVGRRPNGKAIEARRPACGWTSAATSRWTGSCAPTCRTSSPSATSSASRCSRTRPRTKPRSPPK
jgi:dihydrolipoamide dehydrogenase